MVQNLLTGTAFSKWLPVVCSDELGVGSSILSCIRFSPNHTESIKDDAFIYFICLLSADETFHITILITRI